MARMNRQETIENALELGAKLFRGTLSSVPREILDLDVTMPQLKIIFLLFVDGPKRMSDLASELGVTLATTTGLADRLVEKGLVLRESVLDDRRVVLCRLSALGEKSISRLWKSARSRLRDLLQKMDTVNLQALNRVLEIMLAGCGPRIVSKKSKICSGN